jgi:hypothetical protein
VLATVVVIAVGCEIVSTLVTVHPLASLTAIVYVPAAREEAVAEVPPTGDQEYVIGAAPPVTLAVALPLPAPKQVTLVDVTVTCGPEEFATVTLCVPVQRLASVTVSV